ncbi:MAG: FHA domain-containing protein [Acaryochloridaceae cyanobacterium SU_2_1]|nr:FHA domain-containing protein [Acaryochloridaceae cyanobacterium SU_2_1]NJM95062.1 FHA domain-containing protein [Acaryochloridaceae cyanobacterium CSU_5_19]
MLDQKHVATERHVLVINDGKRLAISLGAAAYSVGRDESNAIPLNSPTVSRKHAILLRLPAPEGKGYRYRLIDGDSEGNRSANGVFVNGKPSTSHDLVDGDIIGFGKKIKASYLIVSMGEAEFIQFIECKDFQSLKSSALNPKATLVASDLEMGTAPASSGSLNFDAKSLVDQETSRARFSETIPELDRQGLELSPGGKARERMQTVIDQSGFRLWMLLACLFVLLGTAIGSLFFMQLNQPSPSPTAAPGQKQ